MRDIGVLPDSVRVHGVLHDSRVNGPGRRAVVHLQGCTLGCPGCFNPETHDAHGGRVVGVAALADELLSRAPEGVTVSGGEPFQQLEGLTALLTRLRPRVESLLVFSGYSLEELQALPGAGLALELLDVVVAGRYVVGERRPGAFAASANQRIHCLTDKHSPEAFGAGGVEISILPDGRIVMTGFPDAALRRAVRSLGEGGATS